MTSRLDDGSEREKTDNPSYKKAPEEIVSDGPVPDPTAERSKAGLPAQLRTWTVGNVTTAATVAIFAFILIKVMVVSRGDVATAQALIEAAPPMAVVLDAFLNLAPMIIAFLFVRLWEWNFQSHPADAKNAMLTIAFMIMASLVALVPLIIVVGSVIGTIAGAWTDRRNRRKGITDGYRLRLSNSWTGTILGTWAVGVFLIVNSGLWAPVENVDVKGGHHYVAYVVSSHDGWVTLFDRDKNQVLRERDVNIESRELCSNPLSLINRRIMQLVAPEKGPHYPRCKAR